MTAENKRRLRDDLNGDNGCAYIDAHTGRRCTSKHHVQLDHLKEFSVGDSNEADNLQSLCAQHNRYRWRRRNVGSKLRDRQNAYG